MKLLIYVFTQKKLKRVAGARVLHPPGDEAVGK